MLLSTKILLGRRGEVAALQNVGLVVVAAEKCALVVVALQKAHLGLLLVVLVAQQRGVLGHDLLVGHVAAARHLGGVAGHFATLVEIALHTSELAQPPRGILGLLLGRLGRIVVEAVVGARLLAATSSLFCSSCRKSSSSAPRACSRRSCFSCASCFACASRCRSSAAAADLSETGGAKARASRSLFFANTGRNETACATPALSSSLSVSYEPDDDDDDDDEYDPEPLPDDEADEDDDDCSLDGLEITRAEAMSDDNDDDDDT
jgi:hypothetical protein